MVHPHLRMFSRLVIPVLAVAGLLVALIPPPAASGQSVPTVLPTSVVTITTVAAAAASTSPVASLTSVAVEVTVAPTRTPVPMGVSSVTVVATGTASATATASVTASATASVVPVTTRYVAATTAPDQGLVTYVQVDALGPNGQGQGGSAQAHHITHQT